MAFYRIYPLSPAGRVGAPVVAECADAVAALVAAALWFFPDGFDPEALTAVFSPAHTG